MYRRKTITTVAGSTALLLGVLTVGGCGSSGGTTSGSPAPPKTATGQPATFGVTNASLGTIVVNAQGRTLYLFQRDSGTTSRCTGACAASWPPLRATGTPIVGPGAKASILASTGRADGERQITYNGHPLYLFSGDQKPGDVNGQGVSAFGGLWYAVSPAGDQITTQGPSSGLGY